VPIGAYIVIIKDFIEAISKLRVKTKLEPPGSISSKAKRSVNKTYNKKDRLNSKSKAKTPKRSKI